MVAVFVSHTAAAQADPCPRAAAGMARVDLFFGASRVDRAAWARFLATDVTSRFPDGLTTFEAAGQWRPAGSPRGLVREPTRVVVILYPPSRTADSAIEAIRAAYKVRFRQTSVLRADSVACVRF